MKTYLYQEYCPVTPRVVSALEPFEFASQITDLSQPVSLPRSSSPICGWSAWPTIPRPMASTTFRTQNLSHPVALARRMFAN